MPPSTNRYHDHRRNQTREDNCNFIVKMVRHEVDVEQVDGRHKNQEEEPEPADFCENCRFFLHERDVLALPAKRLPRCFDGPEILQAT
jgi:hypothetical protein